MSINTGITGFTQHDTRYHGFDGGHFGPQVGTAPPAKHTNRIDSNPGRHWRAGASPPGVPPPIEMNAPDTVVKFADLPAGMTGTGMEDTGRCKVWNSGLKKSINAATEREERERNKLGKSVSAPSLDGTTRSRAVPGPLTKTGKQSGAMSQADIREELKRRDQLKKIHATREEDVMSIHERIDRNKDLREQRFNRLMEEVMSEDPLKQHCATLLRETEKDEYRRESAMCDAWHSKVFDRVQRQIQLEMNPGNRELSQDQRGKKKVGVTEPGDKLVATYPQDADPMKADLRAYAKEEHFRRQAERVLAGDPDVRVQDVLAPGRIRKYTQKPTLEPQWWEQLKLQSTPYGHFAQVCEAGQGFRTMVKRGNHAPPEHDGISAAGKRRTRWEKHDLGVLKGEIRHRGEGSLHKTDYGASNTAPNQDHYLYETGRKVVDTEFPLGKRMWLEPPGAVPRSIIAHL